MKKWIPKKIQKLGFNFDYFVSKYEASRHASLDEVY